MSKGLFYPINIIQGETIDIPFDIKENGVFLVMSTLTFIGQVVGSIPTPLAEFTFIVDDDDINIMHAVIESDDTNITPAGLYMYEIRYSDVGTNVHTLLYGSFEVRKTFISTPTVNGQYVNSFTAPPEQDGMFRPIT